MRLAYRLGLWVGYYGMVALLSAGAAALIMWCLPGCTVPDMDDLHLSECLHACRDEAQACLDLNPYDRECLLGAMDCLAVCAEEAEEVLK